MLPRIEFLKIALAHAKANPEFLRDDRGIPAYRFDGRSDFIGLFIPHSLYQATDDIESMTTYELRNAGVLSEYELEIMHDMSDVLIKDESKWVEVLQEMIHDELRQ